jgi:hypothetical protein
MDTRTVGPDWLRSLRPVVVVLVAVAISAGVLVGTVIGTREAASPPEAAPLFLERVDTPGTVAAQPARPAVGHLPRQRVS